MPQQVFGPDNYERWKKSFRNYANLTERIPGATDIDFFIHAAAKNGDRFMVMEFKEAGQPLPTGQRMAFDALRKLGWTVLVVWGPDKEGMYVVSGNGNPAKMDKDGVRTLVESWWGAAKGAA